MPPTSAAEEALQENDIKTGMALMQTVYAVAMALGFKQAVEGAYRLFVPPVSTKPNGLPLFTVALAFIAVVLLAIRFFWVPRNLYAYVTLRLDYAGTATIKEMKRVFTRLMAIYFPLALIHAILFALLCRAFLEMAVPHEAAAHVGLTSLTLRFVSLYGALLLLNAAWLAAIVRHAKTEPAGVWAYNNLWFALIAIGSIGAYAKHELPTTVFVVLACVLFIANSLLDLVTTAPYYILFEHRASQRATPSPLGDADSDIRCGRPR